MLIDDYANTDTPDVTRAVNLFLELHEDCIRSIDAFDRWFKNKGKHIPVCNKVVFVYKESEHKEKIFDVHGNTDKQWYIWGTGNVAKRFWERNGAKNSTIIVATDIYYNEIKEQLIQAGLQEWKDFMKYSVFEEWWLKNWYE